MQALRSTTETKICKMSLCSVLNVKVSFRKIRSVAEVSSNEYLSVTVVRKSHPETHEAAVQTWKRQLQKRTN